MKMWFNGGAVMAVAVFGTLLVAAHPHLSQLEVDADSSSNTDKVFECYARYVGTAQEHGVVLVHTNHPHVTRYVARISSPLIIINMKHRYELQQSRPWPFGLVVLLSATPQEAMHHSNVVVRLPFPHRLTRVLMVITGARASNEIFAFLPLNCVLNLAVLAGNDTRVRTYFPFGGGACGERHTLEVLGECQQLSLDQLYPDKDPKQFNGCEMPIYMEFSPPAVIDRTSHSEEPLVAGYELAMANIISGRWNLTRRPLQIFRRLFCVGVTNYYTDTAYWYLPLAEPRAQWKSVVLVFQAPLWLTILAFFLLNTLAWWLAGAGGYAECVLGSLVTLLNGAVPLPRHTSRRFLVVAWTLCSLVLVAAYQSQLLSTLLTPVPDQQPITNQQELMASDMPIHVDTIDMPNDVSKWYEIEDRMRKTSGSNKPRAVVRHSLTMKYLARNYTDARGNPTLFAFKEVTKYLPLCLTLDFCPALLRSLDRAIPHLVEVGIVAKFIRDVEFSRYWTPGEREDEPLTMRHLDFAFLVLLLGWALATLAFLLEMVMWCTQDEWLCALCTGVRCCGTGS